jgi:hypothetical protein
LLQRIVVAIFVLQVFAPGRRPEARDELLDLRTRTPHPAVELVDDRGSPLEARNELVDVDIAVLEKLHDLVELTARIGVTEL